MATSGGEAVLLVAGGLVIGGLCAAAMSEQLHTAPTTEVISRPAPTEVVSLPLVLIKECMDTYPEVCRYFDPRDGTVCYTAMASGYNNIGISCLPERP